jgi:uncharacterized protein (TIGR03435 family)
MTALQTRRIASTITNQMSGDPNFPKRLFIAFAGLAVVSAAIVVLVGNPPEVRAASPQTAQSRLAFDVISVKRSVSKDRGGLTQTFPGRFVATNATLKMFFRPAYGIRGDYQISGGPNWIDTDRYDVQATTGFSATLEDVHRMLQTLLAEQFRVTLHREPREIPVYALVVGKSGVKLKAVLASGAAITAKDSKPIGQTMVGLAEYLSRLPSIDRPVLDRTGLAERYDVSPLVTVSRVKGANSDDSIFTAIQDFGLKLESQKGIIDVLVIDHAEKPPEN